MSKGSGPCRLEVRGLRKAYGAHVIIRSLDLVVEPGEVLSLLGPSGCGKTTILESIAGFATPDAGDIRIDGGSILGVPPEQRRTAMLFQQYALFPHLTVAQNVGFGLKMRRTPRAEIDRQVKAAIELVQVAALADRLPAQLSGGQRQRVALARALVTRPRVLLLDEPLGALDPALREEMQVELRKLQAALGLTTILVTHDQHEAMVLSDRVAVMQQGAIVQLDSPLKVYDHPASIEVARFMGVENILEVAADASGAVMLGGQVAPGLRAAAPAGRLMLAVRADAIRLAEVGSGPALYGRVAFSQPLGEQVRYEIDCGLAKPLVVAESRRLGAPRPIGARVQVTFPPEHCSVLVA